MPESLVKEIVIDATPEEVWPFLTEARKFARWMGQTVQLDARPGGAHRIAVSPDHIVEGEFVSLTPFTNVVFTFGWVGDDSTVPVGSSTVEITLLAHTSGTLVRLEHSGLPEGGAANHSDGWEHYLARLAIVAAGGDAGKDPWELDGAS
jgi:uncharacterized protein YndB with AHSA1/START domain